VAGTREGISAFLTLLPVHALGTVLVVHTALARMSRESLVGISRMDASLTTTPLYAWHRNHGGKLVDFAGWAMPVQYESISAEHLATRRAATLFDVSHMGRFRFHGPGATHWLDGLLTRRVSDLEPGRIRYSLVTADHGGVLDDVLVYHLPSAEQLNTYLLVVNASNRKTIWDWLQSHPPTESVECSDDTLDTAMIAVQGPLACELVRHELKLDELPSLRYFHGRRGVWNGQPIIYSRTGYTGEDGVELIVPAAVAQPIWQRLLEAGGRRGVRPAGLGARDTLRLEAAMPLYGHELTEQITPLQAGLGFAVDLVDRTFPGHDVLRSLDVATLPCRVGLRLDGKRVARQHAAVLVDGSAPIGEVTSGTFSPSLQQSIAMAYVLPQHRREGTAVRVDVRGRAETAHVVSLPFYQRSTS
jgi:aminomethyltransferase